MAQYTIRVPDDLDESVSAAAAADERSKNGEIIWLLKAGLKARAAVTCIAPSATKEGQA
jgi:hypothetical protein